MEDGGPEQDEGVVFSEEEVLAWFEEKHIQPGVAGPTISVDGREILWMDQLVAIKNPEANPELRAFLIDIFRERMNEEALRGIVFETKSADGSFDAIRRWVREGLDSFFRKFLL